MRTHKDAFTRFSHSALAGLLSLACLSCAQEPLPVVTEWKFQGLHGAVQDRIFRLYYPDFGGRAKARPDLTLLMHSITRFDSAGQLLEEHFYNSENRLSSYIQYHKDDAGRIALVESWSPDGSLEQRARYGYDGRGRRISEDHYNREDEHTGGNIHEYSEDGRLARTVMTARYGDGSSRSNEHSYGYDDQGHLVEDRYYDEGLGGLALTVTHHYEDGILLYSSHYQRGLWLEARVFYSYDQLGNKIREASFQFPEDDEQYESLAREEDLPQEFLVSLGNYEYSYFANTSP